jgi:hypothetical protein
MDTPYFVTGTNDAAPFTLKIHRGDGMVLLAMDWKAGRPPDDFVGFTIQYRVPGDPRLLAVHNRIGFPGQVVPDDGIKSTEAPFQKFRWVHFPFDAGKEGAFDYVVTPMFMSADASLRKGEAQKVSLPLMRETLPGKLNVAFTRGFISSQAFIHNFGKNGSLETLVPPFGDDGLTFKSDRPDAEDAYAWMGFEARKVILALLDQAKTADVAVRAIGYDFNMPELLERLEALGARLKIIIDNSERTKGHGRDNSPESTAAARFEVSAGSDHVKRQHMGVLQHHKSIAVRGGGIDTVIYGSTNMSWRGFYVQSNNALVVHSKSAVEDYFTAFESYFGSKNAGDFEASASSAGWMDLGIEGVEAKVAFSPHSEAHGLLDEIGADIDTATSSVFFSLAFLGQTTKGAIGPALGRALEKEDMHVLGIADGQIHAGNLGLEVLTPDNKRHFIRPDALLRDVPPPFLQEPSALDGHNAGTRMHHKFVVLDFDKPTARVYLGSYNFSVPANQDNGENLVLVKDRTVATSYMIETSRMYDHYVFRVLSNSDKPIELKVAPKAGEKPWFAKDWSDPVRARDRKLFAGT